MVPTCTGWLGIPASLDAAILPKCNQQWASFPFLPFNGPGVSPVRPFRRVFHRNAAEAWN